MEIDFHHTVTYVVARLARFSHEEAEVIADAAQHVDDAVKGETIDFDNGAFYQTIKSAHRTASLRNLQKYTSSPVWLPFHFLPGNETTDGGSQKFIQKLVCRPGSEVAEEMIKETIREKDRPYGLHRLGVAMHVYADTWAHQGFAGVNHKINEVEDAEETGNSGVFGKSLLRDFLDDAAPALGHARATHMPDLPFLQWKYTNGEGELIERNNTDDFCEASNKMCIAMKRYKAGDPDAVVAGIGKQKMKWIRSLLSDTIAEDGDERHEVWLDAIENKFGYSEELVYVPSGKGSWQFEALGDKVKKRKKATARRPARTVVSDNHKFRDEFFRSNWKLFHDALQAHRLFVLNELLPRYRICCA